MRGNRMLFQGATPPARWLRQTPLVDELLANMLLAAFPWNAVSKGSLKHRTRIESHRSLELGSRLGGFAAPKNPDIPKMIFNEAFAVHARKTVAEKAAPPVVD